MGGIFKAIGAVALGVAAAVTFFTGVGAAFTPFLASAALSLGSSYVSDQLAADQAKEERQTPRGTSFEVQLGGDVPRQVAIGTVGTAGQLVYANTYGLTGPGEQPNTRLQLVYVLSDCECDSLEYVFVDGRRKNLPSIGVSGNETSRHNVEDFGADFEVRFFSGAYTQLHDAELTTNAKPSGRWSNNHRGRGVCYVSLTLTYDEKKFPQGMPDLLWQLKGAKLYDSREDTTNGGTGAQRFDDADTWEWRNDPSTAAYHYRRGFYINDQRVLGMAMPAADLLASSYRTAANACDTDADGEPTYAVSVILSDDNQHEENLRALMTAMAGYETERSGFVAVIPGATQSLAGTITDADLAPGSRRFAAKMPRDRLANAVYGKYVEPRDSWSANAFNPFLNSTYETEDGGERLPVEMDFSMVSSKKQAGRLARIVMRENRRQATATIPVGMHLLKYEQGDWITWDSDRYGNTDYRIVAITYNDDDTLTWELREVHAAIYSVDILTAYTPATEPDEDVSIREVLGFNVAAAQVENAAGKKRPALRFTAYPVDDDRIRRIRVRYRPDGETKWEHETYDDPRDPDLATEGFVVAKDILPTTLYEAQARYVIRGKDTNWTASDTVTTLARSGEDLDDNSVERRKLKRAARDPKADDIEFYSDSNTVKNTGGKISHKQADGTVAEQSISSNATGHALGADDTIWVYWPGTGTDLLSTADPAVAQNDDNVVLATYSGGSKIGTSKGARRLNQRGNIRSEAITRFYSNTDSGAMAINGTTISNPLFSSGLTVGKETDGDGRIWVIVSFRVIRDLTGTAAYLTSATGTRRNEYEIHLMDGTATTDILETQTIGLPMFWDGTNYSIDSQRQLVHFKNSLSGTTTFNVRMNAVDSNDVAFDLGARTMEILLIDK